MPVLVAWIGEMLLSTVGQMVISGLVSLGIGFATSAIAGSSVVPGEAQIKAMLGTAGPMVDYVGWFGIDKAITIICSAWMGRAITDSAHAMLVSRRAKGAGGNAG
jgi:hypothetical protein